MPLFNELTTDQKEAKILFNEWMNNDDVSIPFVLSGFAGSGKTFLSVRLLKIFDDRNMCWTVAAPTHKAVGVLRESLASESLIATWFPSTIHRLLRLKLARKGHLEVCEKTEHTANALENLDLVLIDEASMIDSKLLEIVLECAFTFKTRIVFVGDPAQLPPIGENISPVFFLKRACKFQLKKVVRHQGPVLQLATCLRENKIPCLVPPLLPILKSNKSQLACLDKSSWFKQAKESLKKSSAINELDSVRILCYTNQTLERLVPLARRAVHGEMADQLAVLPGEILITRKAVMAPASFSGDDISEEPDMVFGSNRELLVRDVTPESCDMESFGLFKEIEGSIPIIETLKVKVQAGEMEVDLRMCPPSNSKSRKILDLILYKLRIKAKEANKKEGKNIWKKFFLIRDAFAYLGPASVITVHRSQGSTFKEVFIAPDIFSPKDITLARQLLYVAVTRASRNVWLVGGNPSLELRDVWLNQLRI